MKKSLSLALVLMLIFTMTITSSASNTSSTADAANYSLGEVTDKFWDAISGENSLYNLAHIYRGWRTSSGRCLDEMMEYLYDGLINKGFNPGERSTANNRGDSVWFQTDTEGNTWRSGNMNLVYEWNPQYVSLKILTGPTISGNTPAVSPPKTDPYSGISSFRRAAPDLTSPLSQDVIDLCVDTVEFVADCIDTTSIYYPQDITAEWLIDSLKTPGSEDYYRMQAMQTRCHMPFWGAFFAYTDEGKTVEQNIAAGSKQGNVVFVGNIASSGGLLTNSAGIPASELEGKVLLTSTAGSANVITYARNVGAIAALCRVSDAANYHMPLIDGERWYTDYVPYGTAGYAVNAAWNEPSPNLPVLLHFSLDQYDALTALLSEGDIVVEIAALGTYATDKPRRILVAEIQGSTKPEERVYIPAHLQEPGAGDNASGVAMGFEIATKLKEMIDTGKIARPERTITFVWGDEIYMTENWLTKYMGEFLNIKGSIDLDMTGHDPMKTGGYMLIEKTPDPSNIARSPVDANLRYRYGNFTFPGQANLPLNYSVFVREPDKFSLWTGGTSTASTPSNNYPGFFLNDLYLQSGLDVKRHSPKFEVDFNPYEGGSDHEPFVTGALSRVGAFIPALLTWHFTDYVYHSSCDTLDKMSVNELRSVGTVAATVAYQMANAGEYEAADTIDQVMKGWSDRIDWEKANTVRHNAWMIANPSNSQAASSYNRELKAIADWSRWYIEAVKSAGNIMLGGKIGTPYLASPDYKVKEATAIAQIQQDTIAALDYVDSVFGKDSAERPIQIASANLSEPILVKPGTFTNLAGLAAYLPTTIDVEYIGGGTGSANVTWNAASPTFNSSREGLYRVTGTLSGFEDGVVNWAELQALADVNSYNYDIVTAIPSAVVEKLNGNQNDLTITVKDAFLNGGITVYTKYYIETFKINNNAAATYDVHGFKVYVDTKGNDQIREIRMVDSDAVISFSDARFISITETSKNSNIWALTFSVKASNPDGTIDVATYIINLNGNNANLSGKYVFSAGHDLAGLTLTYNIKGNGSNIGVFNIQ